MQFNDVRKLVKEECKEYGIRFHQGRGKTVLFTDGIRSNGYFCPPNEEEGTSAVLAVATNKNSLDVLIHEYSHMQQYLENAPVWKALDQRGQVWDWISGKDDFTEKELDKSIQVYYNVELDCERRSVIQHRKWNTGKDLAEYTQKANAYTLFYFYMRENRVWYKEGKEPYTLKQVWSQMPKSFTFDRLKCYNKVHKLFNLCI